MEIYELGALALQSGATLPDARLAYKTYGSLNADKSNAIVYPTWFTGFHTDNEWLVGPGHALDPSKYFVVVVCAFGNGESSSPSNTAPPLDGPRFPHVTVYDNVTAQHRLITQHFGVTRVKLVVGWSMGAQQTYQWGCLYPDMVERIAPFCGSAKTAPHNFVFLEGVRAALVADAAYHGGHYAPETPPVKGLRAVGRVYAGWGLSQPFYREELWRDLGFSSLEAFLVGFWEAFFLRRDANGLLCMLWTWQHADISANPVFDGDLPAALGAIRARALVMPAERDLYFPPDDNAWEVKHMPNATFKVIESLWGHFAGDGLNAADTHFIDTALAELLSQS